MVETRPGFPELRAGRCESMSEYANDVLVDTQWVEDHLDDESIRIVEVDENPALYAEAHIPGAIGFDWKKDLQDQVKRDFLGPAEFGALFGCARDLQRAHGRALRRSQQLVRRLHVLVPQVLRAPRGQARQRPAREVDRRGSADDDRRARLRAAAVRRPARRRRDPRQARRGRSPRSTPAPSSSTCARRRSSRAS